VYHGHSPEHLYLFFACINKNFLRTTLIVTVFYNLGSKSHELIASKVFGALT